MPRITLVVCLHRERDMLERLLRESAGLFDDLVVVHDGPEAEPIPPAKEPTPPAAIEYSDLSDTSPLPKGYRVPLTPKEGSIHELVHRNRGRFFEGPSCYQQEPHWPFAWWQAKHDWILRLDADEFPSEPLKLWLHKFRQSETAPPDVAGYTCIWPLWDGQNAVTQKWPKGRQFLIQKKSVRFFGMVEQTPIPTPPTAFELVPLVLEHRPKRKSFGLSNLLFRPQASLWRKAIARSLRGEPTDLPRWNWPDHDWPVVWEQIRRRPLVTALQRLLVWPIRTALEMRRSEGRVILSGAASGGIHHFLIACTCWRVLKFNPRR